MLWQILIQQTHARRHTHAHTRVQTGVFPVLRRWGHQQCSEPGRRDRQRERERQQAGGRRSQQLTSLFQKDQRVGRAAVWRTKRQSGWDGTHTPIYTVQGSTASPQTGHSQPAASHRLWNLSMEIPIQFPWYRRAFPHRLADLSMAEPLMDWPLIWPFSWTSPWMRPSYPRWFNWAENGHSEVKLQPCTESNPPTFIKTVL